GTAGITGKGSIESVLINAQGTVIEQSPGKVELAKDITAEIAGKEVRAEEEVKPEPEPEKPEPDLPPVSLKLDSTGSLTLLAGEKGVRTITSVSPGDANIKVSSSKTGVATASLSGNQITITGKGTGTATITVTASKSNYKKKSVSFKVSVVGVKSVGKHENYPLLGSTEIRIFLGGTSSPASYKVSLYGQTLEFEKGYFYLAVPSNSDIAQKSTSEIKGAVVISK
ncbi:MAG TPA: hypothetical protein GX697_06235, partial [Firmicutes bacterium]|nr:hypothetical protein [Bacillota bacterium]